MSGYGKLLDTAPREHSLRSLGLLELAWGSPGLQGGRGHLVLRLLDTQTQLGARRDENRFGAQGPRGKGRAPAGFTSGRRVLGLFIEWLGLVGASERHSAD